MEKDEILNVIENSKYGEFQSTIISKNGEEKVISTNDLNKKIQKILTKEKTKGKITILVEIFNEFYQIQKMKDKNSTPYYIGYYEKMPEEIYASICEYEIEEEDCYVIK